MIRISNRKGLGPFVASIILVGIAVFIAAAVYQWNSGLSTDISRNLENITKTRINCQRSSFYAESFAFNCPNTTCSCNPGVDKNFTFKIRNTGDNDVFLKNLYIKNSTSGLYELRLETNLQMGESQEFSMPTKIGCSGISGAVDQVIITTNCPDVYDVYTAVSAQDSCRRC